MILALLIALLFVSPAYAVITETGAGSQRIGISTGEGGIFAQDLAFPGSVTTGDFLVVAGTAWSIPVAAVGVTSDCSAPLTVLSDNDANRLTAFIAYGFATSDGICTVTVTPTPESYLSFGMDVFSGVLAIDVDGGSAFDSTNNPYRNITTLTQALIIGVVGTRFTAIFTPDVDYTEIYTISSFLPSSVVFRIAPASTYTVNWNLDDDNDWLVYVASFAPVPAPIRFKRAAIIQ